MRNFFPAALVAALLSMTAPVFAQVIEDNASLSSPGGKMIMSALLEKQVIPEDGVVPPDRQRLLEESEIADIRSKTGWGNVFKQMKMEGRFPEYKNLGQLISHFNRPERPTHARSNNVQRTSKGQFRPDRPIKPTRIEKVERPSRPNRPGRPGRP